jgi:hypothetical protein
MDTTTIIRVVAGLLAIFVPLVNLIVLYELRFQSGR